MNDASDDLEQSFGGISHLTYGFSGVVVATEPTHFVGEGRQRKLRPRFTVRTSDKTVDLPVGSQIATRERERQAIELIGVSGDLVTVMITSGMGRGRTPAPGAVPDIGEKVHFYYVPEELDDQATDNARDQDGEQSVRVVTVNQIVAWNVAYWRKSLGLRQEELGQRIAEFNGGEPWSKANVSAAERAWDGTRARRFDADDIYMFARLFGIPMAAMLLPPDDAGAVNYVIGNPALPPEAPGQTPLNEYLLAWSDGRDRGAPGLKGAAARRMAQLYEELYGVTSESLQKSVVETVADSRRALTEAISRIEQLTKERDELIHLSARTQKMVTDLWERSERRERILQAGGELVEAEHPEEET